MDAATADPLLRDSAHSGPQERDEDVSFARGLFYALLFASPFWALALALLA